MEEDPSRKLAVLLHADVVGSTKFVRMSETLAHERMQDAFRRFSKTIDSYAGVAHELDERIADYAVLTGTQIQRPAGYNITCGRAARAPALGALVMGLPRVSAERSPCK